MDEEIAQAIAHDERRAQEKAAKAALIEEARTKLKELLEADEVDLVPVKMGGYWSCSLDQEVNIGRWHKGGDFAGHTDGRRPHGFKHWPQSRQSGTPAPDNVPPEAPQNSSGG